MSQAHTVLVRTLLLVVGLLMHPPAGAVDVIEYPKGSAESMGLPVAMDIVTRNMGHYWLRSLRWTCPYESAGNRLVDNYGVRLENYLDSSITLNADGTAGGWAYFNYPQVPGQQCSIPYYGLSQKDATDLAIAFRRLSKEPPQALRNAILARHRFDIGTASSIDRLLTTDVSLEIANVLLADHMQLMVRNNGIAGEHVPAPAPMPAGSAYTLKRSFVSDQGVAGLTSTSRFQILSSSGPEYEVQKVVGDRVNTCRDKIYFRALTHDFPRDCRDGGDMTVSTALPIDEGSAAYLPANLNTVSFHEVFAQETVAIKGGRGGVLRAALTRACYAEARESVTTAAGQFDTVRFTCGSLASSISRYDKFFGTVWVDVATGLPVKSAMQVHADYSSSRYEQNDEVISIERL